MKGVYMAYVGSYSYTGNAKGITVSDEDVENGRFKERCEMEIDNSSYLVPAANGKTLYSIADEGVVSYRIHENGSITKLNTANIRGMRGCQLSVEPEGKYLFVSGYHDGKSTVMRLNPDGTIGSIAAGVYHKGLGSVAERTFRPHISCTRLTPDRKFVMVADLGVDQVKVYKFIDDQLMLVDTIPCDLESAPRHFIFSGDGKFIYLMYEVKNVIDVYTYETGKRSPKIEKIQTISTTGVLQPPAPSGFRRMRSICSAATRGITRSASTTGIRRQGFCRFCAVCLSAAIIQKILLFSRTTGIWHVSTMRQEP